MSASISFVVIQWKHPSRHRQNISRPVGFGSDKKTETFGPLGMWNYLWCWSRGHCRSVGRFCELRKRPLQRAGDADDALHARKGKCSMWIVNKWEICIRKMGFVDFKWSNLNILGSYASCCHPLFVPWQSYLQWALFMQEKGNAASDYWKSGNLSVENRFCGLKMFQFKCMKLIHPLMSLNFGVHLGVSFSLHAGKGKCCTWHLKKLKYICGK